MTTKRETILKKLNRAVRAPVDRNKTLRRLSQYHAEKRSLEEVVDWALDFRGGGGLYRIKTLQKRSEILSLATMVEELGPKITLEIGTERGGTLLIWAAIASVKAISCDLQEMEIQQELYTKFPPNDSDCEVVLLAGDSHAEEFVERVASELDEQSVDFLFIDGDHTESGVEQDFEMYKQFVRPGGLVAFHDIAEKQPLETNQVQHFWKRVKDNYEHDEFIDNPDQCGYGIGVIHL